MNTWDRCLRCGTVIGDGGNVRTGKRHGWNIDRGGTVACHEATPEQLDARRNSVAAAEGKKSKSIDRTVR